MRLIKIFLLTPIVKLSCTWLQRAMRLSPYVSFIQWITSYHKNHMTTRTCSRCGRGLFGHFSLIYPISILSPSLWETARYRLKYCLKGPLKPKQPTNSLARMRNVIDKVRVNNAFSHLTNVHFEGDKISFLRVI